MRSIHLDGILAIDRIADMRTMCTREELKGDIAHTVRMPWRRPRVRQQRGGVSLLRQAGCAPT